MRKASGEQDSGVSSPRRSADEEGDAGAIGDTSGLLVSANARAVKECHAEMGGLPLHQVQEPLPDTEP